jgi:hypothetical protein
MAAAIDMNHGAYELIPPEVHDGGRYVSVVSLVKRAREGERHLRLIDGHAREAYGPDDWTFVADTIDREVRRSYTDAAEALNITFETLGYRRDTKTFEPATDHDIHGGDKVDVVPPGANYPGWDAEDRVVTSRTQKFGRTWKLPMEAMIRDDADLMLLGSQPKRWGFAARYTMEYEWTKAWAGETTSFFTAANGNYVEGASSALGETSLSAGILQMRSGFTDPAGNPIPYGGPLYLAIPPALERTAKELLESEKLTGGSSKTYTYNYLRNSCILVVNQLLPIVDTTQGSTAWYLFADPRLRPAIRYGYVQRMETPMVFVRETDARSLFSGGLDPINTMFENDSIEFKLRFTFGADLWDFRGAYMSKGAA